MTTQPLRVFAAAITDRIYASARYTVQANGTILFNGTKHDVTNDVLAIIKERDERDRYCGFTTAEALARAVEVGTPGAWDWLCAWTRADLAPDDPPPEDW